MVVDRRKDTGLDTATKERHSLQILKPKNMRFYFWRLCVLVIDVYPLEYVKF